jgi:hypothetical protein
MRIALGARATDGLAGAAHSLKGSCSNLGASSLRDLLNRVAFDPKTAELISFLFNEPVANIPGDLDKTSADGLTAFYEISFSNANIQKLTLEGRLDDIHNGSSGFSSNMKVKRHSKECVYIVHCKYGSCDFY